MKEKISERREKYLVTLKTLFDYSTERFADRKAFVMDNGLEYTFGQFREKVEEVSSMLSDYGLGAGNKVAILSQGTPNWSVALFSLVAYGRISVPILPDASETEISNILSHSETRAIFVSERMMSHLNEEIREKLDLIISIDTLKVVKGSLSTARGAECIPDKEDLATIIYTSGTTGTAKGVMLSHKNFCASIKSADVIHHCYPTDVWLSVLPIAHTYECSFGLLLPIYSGGCVHYISKPPTPTILLEALKTIRPTTMLTVPLIIEKIYRGNVLPTIKKSPVLKWMFLHAKPILFAIVGRKLRKMFGGKLRFYGIGGAKLNTEVEKFLKMAHFPYAIGYGLTETSPLLCGANPKQTKVGSTGKAVYGVTLKLINTNPETGEGEIVAKGDNVMMGYYKNPEATANVFTKDGWFRTNDLAYVDKEGRYYIKGRLSNMILGPSGENIYPEEIEKVINNMEEVEESIVMERNGRLVALVQFKQEILDWFDEESIEAVERMKILKEKILNDVNKQMRKFSRINSVEVQKEPFKKTATRKIKRFLYKDGQNQ